MSDAFGRRFEDPFDAADEPPAADAAGTPDETAVEDVRSQLLDEPPPRAREPEPAEQTRPEPELASAPAAEAEPPAPEPAPGDHAPGFLDIPEGVGAFIGTPNGDARAVGIAVARFNGDVTTRLLQGAVARLEEAGVSRDRIDVMQVPGAFELPLAAMALARTRRYACVLALGCVIRGETPHFDYISAEAASGIQLAMLETGVPVSFGVLTCDDRAQAEARAGGAHGNKGAEAAESGLEMADVFARVRTDGAGAGGV
jgi:6,7-dimethyl-8-ribityllumazine synthase